MHFFYIVRNGKHQSSLRILSFVNFQTDIIINYLQKLIWQMADLKILKVVVSLQASHF